MTMCASLACCLAKEIVFGIKSFHKVGIFDVPMYPVQSI